jgi:hypothetical protein
VGQISVLQSARESSQSASVGKQCESLQQSLDEARAQLSTSSEPTPKLVRRKSSLVVAGHLYFHFIRKKSYTERNALHQRLSTQSSQSWDLYHSGWHPFEATQPQYTLPVPQDTWPNQFPLQKTSKTQQGPCAQAFAVL